MQRRSPLAVSHAGRCQASLNLSELYLAGDGVERDERLAFHLRDQAVKEGVNRARPMLAGLLVEGGEAQ